MSVETEYLLLRTNQYLEKLRKCRSKVVHDTDELRKYTEYIRVLRSIQEKLRKPLPVSALIDPNESKVMQRSNSALEQLEEKLMELRIQESQDPDNANTRRLINRIERKIESIMEREYGLQNVPAEKTPEQKRIDNIEKQIRQAKILIGSTSDGATKKALEQRRDQLKLMLVNAELKEDQKVAENKEEKKTDDLATKSTTIAQMLRREEVSKDVKIQIFKRYIETLQNRYNVEDSDYGLTGTIADLVVNENIPSNYRDILANNQKLIESTENKIKEEVKELGDEEQQKVEEVMDNVDSYMKTVSNNPLQRYQSDNIVWADFQLLVSSMKFYLSIIWVLDRLQTRQYSSVYSAINPYSIGSGKRKQILDQVVDILLNRLRAMSDNNPMTKQNIKSYLAPLLDKQVLFRDKLREFYNEP